MVEEFLGLSPADRRDALETAAYASGRPADLLEKDIWVVWSLDVLFGAPFGEDLCFKGGTSLSKAYGAIDRFSEDVDLTYDIRALLPDVVGDDPDPIPASRSQEKKWTKEARKALEAWVQETAASVLRSRIDRSGLALELSSEGESLIVSYDPVIDAATSYVTREVLLEFGARATGDPREKITVTCDAERYLPMLSFPAARARVMAAERTFWEKATAIHVYCLQRRLRGNRYARHWYDLVQLDRNGFAERALGDAALALLVATHKSWFFREKDAGGDLIDYEAAVTGALRLVPDGDARDALDEDYARMVEAGLLPPDPLPFDEVMAGCREIERRANAD